MLNKIPKKLSLSILALLVVTVISLGAYYFQTNREKEKAKINERRIQQAKQREEAKQDYNNALAQLCSKPLTEASAVQLYNCKELQSSEEDVVDFGLSLKRATQSANLSSFCERKITDMKMLELLECLDDTGTPPED